MIRLVRLADGRASVDSSGHAGGRGAYICQTPGCLESALKRGALARALRGPVTVGEETLAFLQARVRRGSGEPERLPAKGKRG